MKIIFNRAKISADVVPLMCAVSGKSSLTTTEGILIDAKMPDICVMTTYDLHKGVRITVEAKVIEEGCFVINAQKFIQTLRAMDGEEITLTVDNKLSASIVSGRSSHNMIALKGEDFPNIPELKSDRSFITSQAVLKKMISKVTHSIAEADTRPMLCGAFVKVSESGLEMVSCDSYRLSRCRMACDIKRLGIEDLDYSFIIPGHALGELTKILADGEEESCKFYLSRKHAIVSKGSIVFFTRLIDSEYIDYNRIIPRDNDILVTVDRERLLSGLERANIIAEEKIQGSGRSYVKLSCERHYLNLTSTSVNGGVSDEMDCVHEGSDIEIGFNCRYLIDAVKVAEGEEILIKLKSANQAITIEPKERDDAFDYFYMILPVRMNESNG